LRRKFSTPRRSTSRHRTPPAMLMGGMHGDLSSPYFGIYRALAGGFAGTSASSSTFNRKVDLQLRLSF